MLLSQCELSRFSEFCINVWDCSRLDLINVIYHMCGVSYLYMGCHTGTNYTFTILYDFSHSLTLDWCCWHMYEQESIHASPSYNSPWTMPCSIFTYTSEPTALLTASRTLSHVLGCFPVPSPLCNHFWNMALHRVSTSLWSALTVSRTKGSMSSCSPILHPTLETLSGQRTLRGPSAARNRILHRNSYSG